MQIFTEFIKVYGSDKVFYETVRRWEKEILDLHRVRPRCAKSKSGRSVTVTCKKNVSQVREIIERDGGYTIWDNAKAVGAIAGAFYFEAYFESTKGFCQTDTAYIDR